MKLFSLLTIVFWWAKKMPIIRRDSYVCNVIFIADNNRLKNNSIEMSIFFVFGFEKTLSL